MSTINISINCIHHIYKLKDVSGHQYFTSSRNTFHLLLTEIFQYPSQQRDRFSNIVKRELGTDSDVEYVHIRQNERPETLQTQKQNYNKDIKLK